jgi:predicted dehydrogenase
MAIRIGVIGTGNMGSTHVSQFSKMAEVEVVACCDIIRERADKCVREHGAKSVAANLEELLERCDAVVIATPDPCHTAMSLQVLAAGKHLLCEKPLACSPAEARQVSKAAQAASRHGQIHMIHFTYRRSAAMQEAMHLARSGALGQIRQVHSSYLQSWLSCNPAWGNGEGWRAPYLLWKLSTSKGSGGVLGDLGCHLLDLTTACSEELKAVRCELRAFPKPLADGQMVTRFEGHDLDANDMAFMELQFVGGGLGIAHTSRWATGYTNTIRLEVHGTEGAVRLDLDRSYEAIELCLGEARHRQTWDRRYLPPAPSVAQRFIRAIQTGEQEQPDLLRGAQVQVYLECCLRSAESHAWETVPDCFEVGGTK